MKEITMQLEDIPDEAKSRAEVFIIESLLEKDVEEKRLDGEILYQQLCLIGQSPRYIRVNDQNEFQAALVIFRQSNYRFLHISCHGSEDSVRLGADRCDYLDFARMTNGMLKSRRVSFSACKLGHPALAKALFQENKGMHSFLAPQGNIKFGTASVFWASFFTLLYENCHFRGKVNVGHRLVRDTAKSVGNALHVTMLLGQVKPKEKTIEILELENGEEQVTQTLPLV